MERFICGDKPGTAAPEEKQLTNLTARAARAGITIHQLAAGGFLCTRWGLSRELESLTRVEAWLALVTGGRA